MVSSHDNLPSEPTRPILQPHLTRNRLALSILSVTAGVIGQGLLRFNALWGGLLLFAVSVLLIVLALGRTTLEGNGANDPYCGLDRPWQARPGLAKLLGLVGMNGGIVFSVLAFRSFYGIETLPLAWNFYLISLALLLSGALLLTRAEPIRDWLPETSFARWLLLAIFLLALFMRLWRLEDVPFGAWYDEAKSGLQAVRWNAEPSFRPQFIENNPGQLIFLFAMGLRWFGQDIQSLRLVLMALGIAGVIAAYLFGRELRGTGFGLALAFFVAVARWHVNFSRIAMPGVDTPLFEFLSLFFLVRLLGGGRLRDAVWAGLSLGLGLSVYSAFRLFMLALAVFLILAFFFWRDWLSRLQAGKWWRNVVVRLAVLGMTLCMTALPVIHFAWTQPSAFFARVQQTSIFNQRDEPDLGRAIWHNTYSHLLMFNYRGDKNARHNLPGEPMLDPVMGVLFVLGLGLAVAQVRQPANLFFLILFSLGLLGGILSLDFEAPQALRSIAVLPAVVYFCTLSLSSLIRQVEQNLRLWPSAWSVIPILMLGGYVVFFNAHTYFVRQADDFAVWNAFSTAESIIGRRMAGLGSDYVFYLSPFFTNHPTIRFLSLKTPDPRTLTLPDPLPVRQPADRPAALFIHPNDVWIYQAAKRLYPNSEFETIFDPRRTTPVVYQVILDRDDIAMIQGVELRYWANQTWEGPPQTVSRTQSIDVTWPEQSPFFAAETSGEARRFVAEWAGIIYAPNYGSYQFTLRAPAAACLAIAGETLASLDKVGGERTVSLMLAQGNHRLRVRAQAGEGQVSLLWKRPNGGVELIPPWTLYSLPVNDHGLQGSYYANSGWVGPPAFVRIDPFLDMYFHLTPLRRPYSVEWIGALEAPVTGVYAIRLRAVDGAQLLLNGQLVVETVAPGEYIEGTVMLQRGRHDLQLRFKDTMGHSRIHLMWRPPGQTLQAIPPDYLWPPATGKVPFASPGCNGP